MLPLPYEYAVKIAHYFKLYLGLKNHQAMDFVTIQSLEGCIEYRLPFGKFWRNNGKWYVVSCYQDPPQEVETMIEMINVKLAALKKRFEEGKPAWIIPSEVWARRHFGIPTAAQ